MKSPITILMVEDNPGDVRLTEIAMRKGKLSNQMHVAKDGEEALDFLYQRGEFADAPRPHLILLDLNLPKVNGWEVLEEIKSDPKLRSIPVVVLTSSELDQDILRSYDLYANSFITKPVDMTGFLRIVQSIENFWFEIVTLPEP